LPIKICTAHWPSGLLWQTDEDGPAQPTSGKKWVTGLGRDERVSTGSIRLGADGGYSVGKWGAFPLLLSSLEGSRACRDPCRVSGRCRVFMRPNITQATAENAENRQSQNHD